jgi:hypothetical protein
MPFIVTTTTPRDQAIAEREVERNVAMWMDDPSAPAPPIDATPDASVVSRRAVATLDEAHRVAELACMRVLDPGVPWTPILDAAAGLPEAGGKIGPLPDGTTIEVEGVSLVDLYGRAGFSYDAHGPDAMVGIAQVIAAFNEAQR